MPTPALHLDLPYLPDVPPALSLASGGDAVSSAKGNVPVVSAMSLFAFSSSMRHPNPVNLALVRSSLSKDALTAKALQLERAPITSAPAKLSEVTAVVTRESEAIGTPTAAVASDTAGDEPFDTQAAHAALQSMSKLPFPRCRSCLPSSVHERYTDAVRAYLADGVKPPTRDTDQGGVLSQFASVCDLVQREQTAYRKRLHDMVIACEGCQSLSSKSVVQIDTKGTDHSGNSGHVCTNANALPHGVEAFVAARQSARTQAFHGITFESIERRVTELEADASLAPASMRVSFDAYALSSMKTRGLRGPASISQGPWLTASAPADAALPVANLREAAGNESLLFVPSVRLLTEGMNHPSTLEAQLRSVTQQGQSAKPQIWWGWSSHWLSTPQQPHIVICKSALVSLATAHFSNGQSTLSIPVRVMNGVIFVGRPIKSETMPRKAACTTALKQIVRYSDHAVLWKSNAAAQRGVATRASAEVLLPSSSGSQSMLKVVCGVNVHGKVKDGRTLLTLTKLEYSSCKGYNFIPDDAKYSYRLEDFSKKELATAWLVLQLLPQSVLHVHRICAYTQSLLAVEVHDLATISSLVRSADDSGEFAMMWSVTSALLSFARDAAINASSPSAAAGGASEFVLVKRVGGAAVHLVPVDQVRVDHPATFKCAPISHSYPKQEYLPQASWLRPNRIPLTFPTEEDVIPTTASTAMVAGEGDLHSDHGATVKWTLGGPAVWVPRQSSAVAKRSRGE